MRPILLWEVLTRLLQVWGVALLLRQLRAIHQPENNAALHTEELEARIKAFLEEAEEDLVMNDLPPLENTSPLPVPAPVFPDFVPFAVSTGQCCVPPKSLLRKVYHPYKDPVGRCCCEPGGWCDNLPCSGWK